MNDEKKSKGELSREKIVNCALIKFAQQGFMNTSLQEIGNEIGIGQTAILHHYKNKYEVFNAVLDSILINLQNIMKTQSNIHDGAADLLYKSFIGNLTWVKNFPDQAHMIIFLYYTSTHDKNFKKIYTELLEKIRTRYLGIILQGQREQIFHLNYTPDEVAEILHENIVGSIINYLSSNSKKGAEKKLELKWRILMKELTHHEQKKYFPL
ncbi:MAG: TetR/AcrR family transcriptional regulator [Bacteriovoracaceae bacterium]